MRKPLMAVAIVACLMMTVVGGLVPILQGWIFFVIALYLLTTEFESGRRWAKAARRRKRRMDRVEHDLSDEQWTAVQVAWSGCAYCGATTGAMQRDCVLPISRGGRYTLDNIVPACRSCNASKCNDEVTGWLRRKRLDERAFLVRHHEVTALLTPAAG